MVIGIERWRKIMTPKKAHSKMFFPYL